MIRFFRKLSTNRNLIKNLVLRDLKHRYVGSMAGFLWFSWYWTKQQREWNWLEKMPVLITVSVLTAAHGWLFDQLLLTIPVIALFGSYARNFGKIPRNVWLIYTLVNASVMVGGIFQNVWPAQICYLIAPLVLCLALYRCGAQSQLSTPTVLAGTAVLGNPIH